MDKIKEFFILVWFGFVDAVKNSFKIITAIFQI